MTPTAPATTRTRKRRGQDPVAYDFRRPIQLSRDNTRILQIGLDNFARSATTAFTGVLRTIATVSLVSIEQQSYAEYVGSLEPETHMTIIETDPVPGIGVVQMPIESVMLAIDCMLGGPGSLKQPKRPLTEIESNVFSMLMENRLLASLRASLEQIAPMSLTVRSTEFSPQFALASSTADIMIVSTFDIGFHHHTTKMTLALPFSGLNPYLIRAGAASAASRSEQAKTARFSTQLREVFTDVPVEVRVASRETKVGPAQISNLQVGDVIMLGHPAAAPFEVLVNDTIFGHATTGVSGKNAAARIVAIESNKESS